MTTVLTMAGAFGAPVALLRMLRGEVTSGNTVVGVNYANWTLDPESGSADGAKTLNAAILATKGEVVAFGHSLGAVSMSRWLRDYAPTSDPDLPSRLSFILAGNSRRRHTGFLTALGWVPSATIPFDTPFRVIDVARKGDGWAVWPSNILDLGAVMRALWGQANIHPYYQDVSLSDPANATFTEGNVTFVTTA